MTTDERFDALEKTVGRHRHRRPCPRGRGCRIDAEQGRGI